MNFDINPDIYNCDSSDPDSFDPDFPITYYSDDNEDLCNQENTNNSQNINQERFVGSGNPGHQNLLINTPKQFKEAMKSIVSAAYKMMGINKSRVKGKCLMLVHNCIVHKNHQDIELVSLSMGHKPSDYYAHFVEKAKEICETLNENIIKVYEIIKLYN